MLHHSITSVWFFCIITATTSLFGQTESRQGVGPLSPEEALKAFQLHPDCKIELVACEPDVIDPVHIAFDVDGKLWVVEMSDYPNGPEESRPGLSRIRVLSDENKDGRYTDPVTFADKLLFANGLMFWRDGVIVTTDGKIQFMRDTDGDGRSDETQIWFQGFATENPQLRHNHPQLAMDCKIYIANGLRGGDIVPGPDNPWGLDPNAEPLSISGRDFRFNPLTGKYEAIAGQAQFGMTFDRYGNRFVCTNRNPCRHIVLEDEQMQQTPGARISRHYEDVAPAGEDSKLYPLSRTWTTSNLHANQFTAACGVMFYQDDIALFGDPPTMFENTVYTCDPTANLVHATKLVRSGPTFRSIPLEGLPEQREFLATEDEWFRPVNLSHGPDGSIYVVDMYRAVIEHPQFMPEELKDRPDLSLGADRGRVWRVTRDRANRISSAAPMLTSASDLVTSVAQSKLSWTRSHAQRLLLQSKNSEIVDLLRDSLVDRKTRSGLVILNLLNAFDSLEFEDLVHAMELSRSNFAGSTIIALGASRFLNDSRLPTMVAHKLGDSKPLNFDGFDQTFSVLANIPWRLIDKEYRHELLASLAFQCVTFPEKHPLYVDPIWISAYLRICARNDSLEMCEKLIEIAKALEGQTPRESKSWWQDSTISLIHPLIFDLSALVAIQNQPGQVDALLASVFAKDRYSDLIRIGVVAGVASGFPEGRDALLKKLERMTGDNAIALSETFLASSKLFELLVDEGISSGLLRIVLSVLSLLDDDASLKQLYDATASNDPETASLALDVLLKRPAEQVHSALLEILPQRHGSMRRQILQAMAASPEMAGSLLDEIEAGRVPVLEIDENLERLLLRQKDQALVARAKSLIQREPPADRVRVLADYQQVLAMQSDPLRGRIVFEKNCATCHKIGDVGVNVAPDISDSRTKTPDFLLTNILDPNRAIDANYFSYTVADTNGRVFTGVIDGETSGAVTLKQPEGKTVTIPREEIDEMKNNGISLMPVGLERTIDQQQMADVISFIKNWRYLDGSVPKDVIR